MKVNRYLFSSIKLPHRISRKGAVWSLDKMDTRIKTMYQTC